jgi:mRNA interferase MazF
VAFEQWQVVVVPFPFTDRPVRRRRPALVVSRSEALGNRIGHSVLAMITSAGHSRWPLDVPVSDLGRAGLPSPSVVRMKLFTLDDRLVERAVGRLCKGDTESVVTALGRLFGCGLTDTHDQGASLAPSV